MHFVPLVVGARLTTNQPADGAAPRRVRAIGALPY